MKKAVRLKIIGSVQGIFFRQFVKEHADKLSITGFVRNLPDGNVEAFLEGQSDQIDSLIALCRRGPQHSQIRAVEEKEERLQDFKEFKILKV